MNKTNQDLGHWGERKTVAYLQRKGYRIIDTNVRTLYGEIDLIADHRNVLIFVEVKTRSSSAFGFPEEAITQGKREPSQKWFGGQLTGRNVDKRKSNGIYKYFGLTIDYGASADYTYAEKE